MRRWYAVYCKPQQDARAEVHLRNQAYGVFRPLVRLRRRYSSRFRLVIESMFPRYLFIQLDDLAQWAPIRSTRGVVGLVHLGADPSCVPEGIITELQQRTDTEHCLHLDTEVFRSGDCVRIVEGPFQGCEGLFDRRNGEARVIVLLEVMKKTQRMVLPETAIAGV